MTMNDNGSNLDAPEPGKMADTFSPQSQAEQPPVPHHRRAGWAGLVLLCGFLFFFRLGSVPLFDLDEALYVTCARNMAQSGDIVTPRLNARPPLHPEQTTSPFYEKPIFVYWASALSMRLFGANEWAARLPVALAGLATTLAVAFAGMRWFGFRAGLFAGIVYAACPLTILDARQMTTDGLLVAEFTFAMLAFAEILAVKSQESGQHSPLPVSASDAPIPNGQNPKPETRHWLAFWFWCALAVLTKGVVGLLLPLLVIGIHLIFARLELRLRKGRTRTLAAFAALRINPVSQWRPVIARLRPIAGLLFLIVLAAPWHLLIWRTGEQDALGRTWVQEYIIRQHIGRFRGLDKVHNAPIFTFVLYFLVGFFPWACLFPVAVRRRKEEGRGRGEDKKTRRQEGMGIERPGELVASLPDGKNIGESVVFPAKAQSFSNAEDKIEGTSLSPLLPVSPSSPLPLFLSFSPARFLRVWFGTIFVFFSLGAAKLPTYIAPAYPAAALLVGLWLDGVLSGRAAERKTGRSLRNAALGATLIASLLFVGTMVGPRFAPRNAPIEPAVAAAALHVTGLMLVGCLGALACFRRIEPNAKRRQTGLAIWAAMLVGVVGVGCTEGYAVAARYILRPYQAMAEAARSEAQAGVPVVYWNIVPRRPSMLFYARDYAPYEAGAERDGKPVLFLPYLRLLLARSPKGVAVITSDRVWNEKIRPELSTAPSLYTETRAVSGGVASGWRLVHIGKIK